MKIVPYYISVAVGLTIPLLTHDHAFADVAITAPGTAIITSPVTNGTFGYRFIVGSQTLAVTALGLWDAGEDGLAMPHQLAMWDGSGALLKTVTIPVGTLTTKVGEFRYQALPAPLFLTAGNLFTLGATYVANDLDQMHSGQLPGPTLSPPTFSEDIVSAMSRYILGGFTFPTFSIGGAPYVGPNFQYFVVPEPSTASFFLLAAVILLKYSFIPSRRR